jgi:hypothetical protein
MIQEVLNSMKRKKSSASEALRLGISIEEYNHYKKIIQETIEDFDDSFDTEIEERVRKRMSLTDKLPVEKVESATEHHNLDVAAKKFSKVVPTYPKTPEEVCSLLNIDQKNWKLSQYWVKERKYGYYISALVTQLKNSPETFQEDFLKELSKLTFEPLQPKSHVSFKTFETAAAVLSLQDIHFGKENNQDIYNLLQETVQYLAQKATSIYNVEKLYLILGPDTLNMDTFHGATTKGTPVDNSASSVKTYIDAFNCIRDLIHKLTSFFPFIHVVYISGNHDRLSSFHLLHALKQSFMHYTQVEFDERYDERKVYQYGQNMLCFEHGDVVSKNNPLVYATEFPMIWGNTKHRFLYTGHLHGRKTKEFYTENEQHGFVTRVLPALCQTDYWHYHNKYVGNKRSAIIHFHHSTKGLLGEFSYNAD